MRRRTSKPAGKRPNALPDGIVRHIDSTVAKRIVKHLCQVKQGGVTEVPCEEYKDLKPNLWSFPNFCIGSVVPVEDEVQCHCSNIVTLAHGVSIKIKRVRNFNPPPVQPGLVLQSNDPCCSHHKEPKADHLAFNHTMKINHTMEGGGGRGLTRLPNEIRATLS